MNVKMIKSLAYLFPEAGVISLAKVCSFNKSLSDEITYRVLLTALSTGNPAVARIKLSYLHFCQGAVKECAWEIWHGDMVRFGFRDPSTLPKPTVAVVTLTVD